MKNNRLYGDITIIAGEGFQNLGFCSILITKKDLYGTTPAVTARGFGF